jgi:CDGSH-type Zn-finger protein
MKDIRRQWLRNLRDGLIEEIDDRMDMEEPPNNGHAWGPIDVMGFKRFMRARFKEYIEAAAREIKKRTWPCGCGLVEDQPVFCGTHARSLKLHQARISKGE